MALYNAEAIVVRVRDFDEADKIAVLLTRDEGKIQAIAKGARRPRSRYAAAVQLFTHIKVALFQGRHFDTFSQVEIQESFRHLGENLQRMAYATYVCELMDEMVKEKQRHEATFLLLLTTLHLLNAQELEPEPILRAYELKLLSMMGFRPNLEECVSCGGVPVSEGPVRFAPSLGGLLCTACTSEGEIVRRISRGTLETMKRLLDGDIRRAHMIRLGGEILGEIDRSVSEYISLRTERKMKSKEFLDTLRSV